MQPTKRLKNLLPSNNYSAGSNVATDAADSSFFGTAKAFLTIGAVNGTPASFTLNVKLQGTLDGTNYYDIPNATFKQQTAIGQSEILCDVMGYQKIKAVYSTAFINGTLPTLTFAIDVALVLKRQ